MLIVVVGHCSLNIRAPYSRYTCSLNILRVYAYCIISWIFMYYHTPLCRPGYNSWLSGILRSQWRIFCETPWQFDSFINKIHILGRNLLGKLLFFKENFEFKASKTLNSKKMFYWFMLSYIIINFLQFRLSILPNIFCQLKYFLGTRIPGYTTISTSGKKYD